MAQGSYRSTPDRTPRIERAGRYKKLLRRERDDAGRGIDVDREAVEEVAPEEAVAGARDVVGRDLHAVHARLADLQRLDDDERASRCRPPARRSSWPRSWRRHSWASRGSAA